MELDELRKKIDEIDKGLVDLFQKRMDISKDIAIYKQKNNLPIYDPVRENQKLTELKSTIKEDYQSYLESLYLLLFELSRKRQEEILSSLELD